MTIKIDDLEQPSIDSIKGILPFVEPSIDPTMRALLKASSYISPSSYNSSYLSLNPSCREEHEVVLQVCPPRCGNGSNDNDGTDRDNEGDIYDTGNNTEDQFFGGGSFFD
jgi:hypothetical protein